MFKGAMIAELGNGTHQLSGVYWLHGTTRVDMKKGKEIQDRLE